MLVKTVIKQTIELQDTVLTLNTTKNVINRIYLHPITDANKFEYV